MKFEYTRLSPAASPSSASTLVMRWRVREGGSSAHAPPREFADLWALRPVSADGHPIVHVVRKQLDPFVEPPLVKEQRLAIEKPFDLQQDGIGHCSRRSGPTRR